MNARWISLMLVAALACGLVAGHALAEDEPAAPQASTPGAEHKGLHKLVGAWDAYSKFWPTPDAKVIESKDEVFCTSIMGGWFVEQVFSGDFAGTKWAGRLTLGYDQVNKEYVSVWIADLGSHVSVGRGTADDKGVLHFYGNDVDHNTMKNRLSESTLEWVDEHTAKLTSYWLKADKSRDSKLMEIVYKPQAKK